MSRLTDPSISSGNARGDEPWKALAVALSLANLCFLHIWASCLPTALGTDIFFVRALPSPAYYVALAANVVGAALLLWGLRMASHRLESRVVRLVTMAVYGIAIVVLLNGIRYRAPELFLGNLVQVTGLPVLLALLLVVGSALAILAWKRWSLLVRVGHQILLVLVPFVGVTFWHAAWAGWGPIRQTLESVRPVETSEDLGSPSGSPVLLLIFDELDYGVTFANRPTDLHLPNLDRLVDRSVSVEGVVPPGLFTHISIPSLLLGRDAIDVFPAGPTDGIALLAHGGGELSWTDPTNLFERARSDGIRTAVVGWHLPYCRAFGASLETCTWEQHLRDLDGLGFWEALRDQWRDLLFTVPLTYRAAGGDARLRRSRVEQQTRLLKAGLEAVSNPTTGFDFLHFPIPHPPCIYDRRTSRLRTDGACDYLDNMVLMDQALGEIQARMETAGTWDSTAVILTSDHPWRRAPHEDPRVPLIVRLPGQKEPHPIQTSLSTTAVHDLVLALLDGRAATVDDVVARLGRGDRP